MIMPQKIHKPINLSFDEVLKSIADENKPLPLETTARPFLKWAGGKRSILQELTDRMPKEYKTYYEPFLGGAALFFLSNRKKHIFRMLIFILSLPFALFVMM